MPSHYSDDPDDCAFASCQIICTYTNSYNSMVAKAKDLKDSKDTNSLCYYPLRKRTFADQEIAEFRES